MAIGSPRQRSGTLPASRDVVCGTHLLFRDPCDYWVALAVLCEATPCSFSGALAGRSVKLNSGRDWAADLAYSGWS